MVSKEKGTKNFKRNKFEERLLLAVNNFVRKEVRDPSLQLVSFTKVQLNVDLSVAKIYWDTFDSGHRGTIKKTLQSLCPKLRHYLAQHLDVRHVPAVSFYYDSQYEAEKNISDLLLSNENEDIAE